MLFVTPIMIRSIMIRFVGYPTNMIIILEPNSVDELYALYNFIYTKIVFYTNLMVIFYLNKLLSKETPV